MSLEDLRNRKLNWENRAHPWFRGLGEFATQEDEGIRMYSIAFSEETGNGLRYSKHTSTAVTVHLTFLQTALTSSSTSYY